MSEGIYKTRSLAKGSIIYGIGNIGTLVINFFLVPLYTFYLSNEDLGYFDLVASALILIAPVIFGHIELAVIRWVIANNNKENVKRVVTSCFIVYIVGLLIFSLVYIAVNFFVTLKLAPYVYLYFVSNFFYIIAKQIVRSVYSSAHYVFTELIYILIVLLCTVFLVEKLGLISIFVAYGFASLAFLLYLLLLGVTSHISLRVIKFKTSKELLSYSFPLVLNTMSLWLNNQSSKYIIASFLSLSANGVYAIAFKIAYVIQILNRIFYFSFQDKMYAIYGMDGFKEYFAKTFKTYSVMLFSLWYLMIGGQRFAIPLIIDNKFLEAMDYIPILGLGIVFMSLATVLGIIYQCEKKNMNAFKTSFVSGIAIVLLGFLIIPYYGLYGASLVFTLGNCVWLFYRFFDVQRFIRVKIPFATFIINTTIGVVIWIVSLGGTTFAFVGSIALAIIMSAIMNRESIIKYYGALWVRLKG